MINPINSSSGYGLDLYRNGEAKWRGNTIWHAGNLTPSPDKLYEKTAGRRAEVKEVNDGRTVTRNTPPQKFSRCRWE